MDEMDEHDLAVHRDQGPCSQCGAPYVPKVKWNGGNVVSIFFPTCDCAEKATEALIDRMFGDRCGAHYGTGDGGSAICQREKGHPSFAEDGIGHSPYRRGR